MTNQRSASVAFRAAEAMNIGANPKRMMEYEIKLDLGNEDQYKRLLASLGAPKSDIRQKNYFFDTSDNRLLKLHWALRVRTSIENVADESAPVMKAEITLKGPQEGAEALSVRSEFNAELPTSVATASVAGGFDLTALDLAPIIEARKTIGEEKLIPLISFSNLRLVFDASPDCDCLLEIDHTDYGEKAYGYELEIEFPEPQKERISDATAYIQGLFGELAIPYSPQRSSKFAIALARRSLLR